MLLAKGHRVLHSSRHAALELGKDIITLDPDGIACAYQLKGQPGGRLTLRDFRSIESQLHELATLPLVHPSAPQGRHRAILVTNGSVEEEVQRAIDDFNRAHRRKGTGARKLELVQSGELLADAKKLGTDLWPSELQDVNLLLEILVEDGAGEWPKQRFHTLLVRTLCLEEGPQQKLSGEAVGRHITSAALLTAVATKSFAQRDNHFAVITAWAMFCAYAIAACERHRSSFAKHASASVALGEVAIRDALSGLVDEIDGRDEFIEGDRLVDWTVYSGRYILLLGLVGLFWLWCDSAGWPNDEIRGKAERFVLKSPPPIFVWGEGCIPQLLAHYWAFRRLDASIRPEQHLAQLVQGLVHESHTGDLFVPPSPYFGLQDVIRHILAPILGREQDPLARESDASSSYFAEGLLHLLVRTGLKQTCKTIWPTLTKVEWLEFHPEPTWRFCLWRTDHGRYVQRERQLTKQWDELVKEARDVRCVTAPGAFAARPFLLALWLILCPQRATADVLRFLGWKFDETWFIGPPISA